jgi:LPS export ABC transporter permease LptF/LPS export ABC transporter permease LptG
MPAFMRRRLDRYLIGEVLGPLALGFGVYTFIMLVRFLFRSADMIIRRGLSPGDVGHLLLLSLPNIVVLTIPMALLFGILIAIGRLAADSELIALRACGVSLFSLYRPILALSLALTVGNTFLTGYVLPRANDALQLQQLEIMAQTASRQVEPRVFYEEWDGHVLYVFEIPPGTDDWQGVFLASTAGYPQSLVTLADHGRLRVDEGGERIVLALEGAVSHRVDVTQPERYEIIRHERLEVVLEDQFTSGQIARISASKGVRQLTLTELAQWRTDSTRPAELRRLAGVEIHKKFSIPSACLVFGLFAVPLGFNNRRGGKSSGFAISIAVILVYYVLLNNGEEAARLGKLSPWLAMWLPNLVFTAFGLYLLYRRNRDHSVLPRPLDRWLRTSAARGWALVGARRESRRLVRVQPRPGRVRPGVVLRIPRWSLPFPNTLDRYVSRLFAQVFSLVALSGLSLYIIADFTDLVDDIMEHSPGLRVVVTYYLYAVLQIFVDIGPILVLVATLLTFALLARSNEITACKALGISLYRLALPALAAAALIASASGLLQAEVLPAANQRVAELKDRMKGRTSGRTYRRADRQWLYGQGPYFFNFLYYDPERQMLNDLQVFELTSDRQLQRRVFADEAWYRDGRWTFTEGWARSFEGALESSYLSFAQPRVASYPESPAYFGAEARRPEQMHYGELRRTIEALERRGQAVPELWVELHSKAAFPALTFVMALVALPFAFRLGRRGALYGVGLSLVLGMVLLGVFAFFTTLGEIGALPALVAVWGPGAAFAVMALYLLLGVRT